MNLFIISLPWIILAGGVSISLDLIHYFEIITSPPFLLFSCLHSVMQSSLNEERFTANWYNFKIILDPSHSFSLLNLTCCQAPWRSGFITTDQLVCFQKTLVLPAASLLFSLPRSTASNGHFSLSPTPIFNFFFLLYSVCIKLKSHQLALQWPFQLKKKTHITALFPANFIHIFYVLVGVWAAALQMILWFFFLFSNNSNFHLFPGAL